MRSQSMTSLRLDMEVQRDGFHLEVALEIESDVMVLFGPSGAGKSTMLQAIAGLVKPQSGEIVLDGETLFRRGREGPVVNVPARKRRVGYVFQDYALFPHLTALWNVAYPLWRRLGAEAKAMELLERVALGGMAHRYPDELSGGQQQRVAIARALAAEPRVLLLDEPFSALDVETRRQVRTEVRSILEDFQISVVLVTHDREDALSLGSKVAVIDAGKIVAEGEPVTVLGHPPRERVARLVGLENMLRLEVTSISPAEGVMRCERSGFVLDVPLSDAKPGDEVTVGLRADDVLLASAKPVGLSARNLLPGKVVSVQSQGPIYQVVLDCGVTLISHVTRRAVEELGIKPGADSWAVIKTASCFILRE